MSECVGICDIDWDSGYCNGCGRSTDAIFGDDADTGSSPVQIESQTQTQTQTQTVTEAEAVPPVVAARMVAATIAADGAAPT